MITDRAPPFARASWTGCLGRKMAEIWGVDRADTPLRVVKPFLTRVHDRGSQDRCAWRTLSTLFTLIRKGFLRCLPLPSSLGSPVHPVQKQFTLSKINRREV